jgi:tyrosine-protein phosphatase SIW14
MIQIVESKMAPHSTSNDGDNNNDNDDRDLRAHARRAASALSIAIVCAAALGCTSTWASGAGTNAPPAVQPSVASAPRPALAPRNDIRGLSNFAKVSSALYRGAQPSEQGFEELKRMGVKTIVNLRWLHSDDDEIEGLGFQHAHIPSKAWHPSDEQIARFLAIVSEPANQPVFVHCQHGADRTGAAVAAYRIVYEGWKPEDAEGELKVFGFHEIWAGIPEYVRGIDAEAMRTKAAQFKGIKLDVIE